MIFFELNKEYLMEASGVIVNQNSGFMYKAFIHGSINNNFGKTIAVSASLVMYIGLASLGYSAVIFAVAYKASVVITSSLLLEPTILSVGAGLALATFAMGYFGTRTLELIDLGSDVESDIADIGNIDIEHTESDVEDVDSDIDFDVEGRQDASVRDEIADLLAARTLQHDRALGLY